MYKELKDEQEILALCQTIKSQQFCSVDTEFIERNGHKGELLGISVSYKYGDAYFITQQFHLLKCILENKDIRKYFHNAKCDYQILRANGIEVKGIYFDTMLAHYLIDPIDHHGLKYLTEKYFGFKYGQLLEDWFKDGKNFREFMTEYPDQAVEYACTDADYTLRLAGKLKPLIEVGFKKLFYDIEMPLVPILAQMEQQGVHINRSYLQELEIKYKTIYNDLEKQLVEIGTPFIR
jgi:DNA polymerase-1